MNLAFYATVTIANIRIYPTTTIQGDIAAITKSMMRPMILACSLAALLEAPVGREWLGHAAV